MIPASYVCYECVENVLSCDMGYAVLITSVFLKMFIGYSKLLSDFKLYVYSADHVWQTQKKLSKICTKKILYLLTLPK